jgi:hypothetical protein
MPARVIENPLAVEFVFSDASRFVLRLSHLPCPGLVADLAVGLAGLAHPNGGLDSAATAAQYRTGLGQLARFLDGAGFSGGAAGLTRARLIEFWMGTRPTSERLTRAVLRSLDTQTGVLRPEVRDYLPGQALQRARRHRKKPYAPYSDGEWTRLWDCCVEITETAFAEYRSAVLAGRAGQDPATAGWSVSNLLWLLLHRGPISQPTLAKHLGCTSGKVGTLGGVVGTAKTLFPTVDVALAYRLMLGMTTGIVPDGLDELELDDIEWAGDSVMLLDYIKGRRGPESLTLPKPAVRVLRRWLEHSALLRHFAPEPQRSQLWLVYFSGAGTIPLLATEFSALTVQRWVQRHQLAGDDRIPLRIHKHRIRTTFENRRDKSRWTGRTTIDPNHSAQVEGDHYLSRPTPEQQDALDAVVEDAQTDLVRKARTPLVLATEDIATAAAALPHQLAGLEVTDTVIAELVGGQRDVFTAACGDQLAGLHGPTGQPCPARPWVCLLCPLAVFAPRHAPNLLRLKAFFARQFRLMPVPQFMAVFGRYADRLDHDILARFSSAVLAAAASQVSGRDDELPLRPEETTA